MEWGKFGKKHLEFILNPIEKDAFFTVLQGAVRSGKTVAMIPKWLNYIKNGPPGLLLMTGVTKETVHDNVLSDLFDVIGAENHKYNRQTGDLVIFGRKIKVMGAKDEGSEKYLRGKTLAGAYCDELSLMPESFFLQLYNRLSVKGAKLYATTNPDSPYHYLYKDFLTNEDKLRKGEIKNIHFNIDDNPNLSKEYIERIKNAYTGVWHDRMVKGLWVLAEGRVYDMFEKHVHVVPTVNRKYTEYYVAIDHGVAESATVFLLIGKCDNVWYVVKEYVYSGKEKGRQKTDVEYMEDLQRFLGNVMYKRIVVDSAATAFITLLRRNGFINIVEADKDVLNGIREVSNMLHKKEILVNDCCTTTIQEFGVYSWDTKAGMRGETRPIKMHDHCMDALRYFVFTALKPSKISILK